ncbi:unnamed protein product [Clonostachys rosea]|uniref:L-ornithine N(5)-monooxygenase [NAD(P)H] n=1 Tax=Bionectria ochroleuca TaxID=29856 RepID=A0ABY6U3Q4_BIOOC|nr:unnamed protein product [Clonostachys rosea]
MAATVIIIGAGPSGIATAHKLKAKLGFDDFLIYDKLPGLGGTWMTNRYPGCGCDIPAHIYTFSFNLNPDWSANLVDRDEILQYMNNTVDKFKLREHMIFEVECLGASWDTNRNRWEVHLQDTKTGKKFDATATALISAVGAISYPKKVQFPGMDKFQGRIVHTAEWNLELEEYQETRMAVIGNGCSAAQLVPNVVKDVGYLKQYAREAQWFHERPNQSFSTIQRWAFRNIPGYNLLLRFWLFATNDSLAGLYESGPGSKARVATESQAKEYIYSQTPAKYHSFIAPEFPLGCKRRIWNPGYLESLWEKNMDLVPEGIQEFTKTGIISSSGQEDEFDIIVTATGFQVTSFLIPMTIVGMDGNVLHEQWAASRGPQAYYGCFVHNFPNFAMLFGPNTFPAHNSALFAIESSLEFITKTMLAPLVDRKIRVIDVKHSAEQRFVNRTHERLTRAVYSAGCSSWFVNELGKNVTSWPGYAISYYAETFFPRFGDFSTVPGSRSWPFRRVIRWVRMKQRLAMMLLLISAMGWIGPKRGLFKVVRSSISGLTRNSWR